MRKVFPLLFLCLCLLGLRSCFGIASETPEEPIRTAYAIEAELLPKTHSLNVTTTIRYILPQDDLAAVKLRLYANAYPGTVVSAEKKSAAYPNGVSYGGCEVLSVESGDAALSYEVGVEDPTLLSVRLGAKGKKGDEVSLTIRSVVTLANVKHRLGYADDHYILSGFYPVVCPYENGTYRSDPYYVYGDPFFHETSDFDVTLITPATQEVAASALPTEVRAEGAKTLRLYENIRLREFACVASSRLLFRECTAEGVTLRYYYEKDDKSADTLAYIQEAIRTFSTAFGDHPYPAFSVVQAPFFEAGMEFSGLALVNKELSASERKRTILHETAHEWWHGKVGSDEISHPWQDEAVTEYSVLYFYKCHNADALAERMVNDAAEEYALYAAVKGDSAVEHPLSLGEEGYVESTYRKGLLMMSSLAEKVGCEEVNLALKSYAELYRDAVAPPEALISALSEVLRTGEEDFFERWLHTPIPIL